MVCEVAVTTPEKESGAVINTPVKAAQGLVVVKESAGEGADHVGKN